MPELRGGARTFVDYGTGNFKERKKLSKLYSIYYRNRQYKWSAAMGEKPVPGPKFTGSGFGTSQKVKGSDRLRLRITGTHGCWPCLV